MIIGLDMGGSHVDSVLIANNKIIKISKIPYTKDNIYNSIIESIQNLLIDQDYQKVKKIQLSTTLTTNALYSNNLDKTAIIVDNSPGRNYQLEKQYEHVFYIDAYCNHQGEIVRDLTSKKLIDLEQELSKVDINTLAVATKFSNRNFSFENKIYDYFKDKYHFISLGHLLSDNLNYYRRINTSYLNSATYLTFSNFATLIQKGLKQLNLNCEINVLKPDGGSMSLQEAIKKPSETILSGPAASLMGIKAFSNFKNNHLLLDVGGSTTEIFFVLNKDAIFEHKGITINNYQTLIRSIYSKSVNLGGDSKISIVDNKTILTSRVDQAFIYGGKHLTLTDALALLDYIEYDKTKVLAKQFQKLNSEKDIKEIAKEAIDYYLKQLFFEVKLDLKKFENHPVYTIKEVLNLQKIALDSIYMIGGLALDLKPLIKETFNLNVEVLKHYQVLNAVGAALVNKTLQLSLYANTENNTLIIPSLNYQKKINDNVTLKQLEDLIKNILVIEMAKVNREISLKDVEIIESNQFNKVSYNYKANHIYKIKAQVKPSLIKVDVGGSYE